MALQKLELPPDQNSYQINFGTNFLTVKLDGGKSWYRQDKIGDCHRIHAKWTLGPDHFNYFSLFYEGIGYGADSFYIDLLVNSVSYQEFEAHIVEDTFKLTAQYGLTYVLEADLEIVPTPTSPIQPSQFMGYTIPLAYGNVYARGDIHVGKWHTPPGSGFIVRHVFFPCFFVYAPQLVTFCVYDTRVEDGTPGTLIGEMDHLFTSSWYPGPMEYTWTSNPLVLASDTDYYLGCIYTRTGLWDGIDVNTSWNGGPYVGYSTTNHPYTATGRPPEQFPLVDNVNVVFDAHPPSMYLRTI